MADSVVFGQVFPAAMTLTDLFTASGNVTIGTIDACNFGPIEDLVRITLSPNGGGDSPEQYVIGGNLSGLPVPAGDTWSETKGRLMQAGSVIRVYSTNGTTAFNLSGIQWG